MFDVKVLRQMFEPDCGKVVRDLERDTVNYDLCNSCCLTHIGGVIKIKVKDSV